MKTPDYWLNRDYTVYKKERIYTLYTSTTTSICTLEKGTFVRPIWNKRFVPKEILEEWIGDEGCVYCYTALGIYPIPEKFIEIA